MPDGVYRIANWEKTVAGLFEMKARTSRRAAHWLLLYRVDEIDNRVARRTGEPR